MRRAHERKLALREYSDLHYYPGKGLVCRAAGTEILVGTRQLFEERGIALPIEVRGDRTSGENSSETTVLVGCGKELLGTVTLADELRAEAKEAVAELNRRGYRTILLTGDAVQTAQLVGKELGVGEAFGGLLPDQKLEKIRQLLAEGRKVAMVGDGVNDAPALVEATVGIAMGQGTDVALESADVTLMTSDLSRLVEVLTISRRCYAVIMFNFWGTILVDTAGIVLALFWSTLAHHRRAHSRRLRARFHSQFRPVISEECPPCAVKPISKISKRRTSPPTADARLCKPHPKPISVRMAGRSSRSNQDSLNSVFLKPECRQFSDCIFPIANKSRDDRQRQSQ